MGFKGSHMPLDQFCVSQRRCKKLTKLFAKTNSQHMNTFGYNLNSWDKALQVYAGVLFSPWFQPSCRSRPVIRLVWLRLCTQHHFSPVMKNAKRVSPIWAVSLKLSKACYCSWKSDTHHQHPLKLSGQARFLLTLLLKLLKPLLTRLAFTYHWYSWGFYIRAKELRLTQWSRGTFKSPESFWLQTLLICSLQALSVQ